MKKSFLNVEWAKRWLPAIFLLLSLHLPWSTVYSYQAFGPSGGWYVTKCSFLWSDCRLFLEYFQLRGLYFEFHTTRAWMPAILASSLIMLGGLAGLSGKNRTRRLGGFFGILGILIYFLFVFPHSNVYDVLKYGLESTGNPYFGISYSRVGSPQFRGVWFLSPGFFLALAGSLMLLSPLIRTLIETLKKRLKSS